MSRCTKVIILAAGEGKRLRPFSENIPKCMVQLNGKALLDYQLECLRAFDFSDIVLVTGYKASCLDVYNLPMIHNSRFDETNMVSSLMCARPLFNGKDDVIVTYGDIIYSSAIMAAIATSKASFCTTIDKRWLDLWQLRQEDPLNDAETLKMNPDLSIIEIGKKPQSIEDIEGQYMGIIKFGADIHRQVLDVYDALDATQEYDGKSKDQMYMTSFLTSLFNSGIKLQAVPIAGEWLEVDTVSDLQTYEKLLHTGQLSFLQKLRISG